MNHAKLYSGELQAWKKTFDSSGFSAYVPSAMHPRYEAAAEEKKKNYMKKIMRIVVMIKTIMRRTSTTEEEHQLRRQQYNRRERENEAVNQLVGF